MQRYPVPLSTDEVRNLDRLWPRSKGPSATENRALAIVEIHFLRQDPGCRFEPPKRGADVVVTPSKGAQRAIEVKGTASSGIAGDRIVVSSGHSRRLLTEQSIPLFRVSDVYGQKPE